MECESWPIKKAERQRTDGFELGYWRLFESPLDCKEIQPVHPKGNQSWIFIERTDVEAETPILWPLDAKNWLIWKDSDAGKDLRREDKGMTEDEMVGWYHWLHGHEFEQAPGVGDGQESLGCCSPWGHKESDTTEQLNWTDRYVHRPRRHSCPTVDSSAVRGRQPVFFLLEMYHLGQVTSTHPENADDFLAKGRELDHFEKLSGFLMVTEEELWGVQDMWPLYWVLKP